MTELYILPFRDRLANVEEEYDVETSSYSLFYLFYIFVCSYPCFFCFRYSFKTLLYQELEANKDPLVASFRLIINKHAFDNKYICLQIVDCCCCCCCCCLIRCHRG